jgi:glycosyltransferase involved in cell wall biosynthesis
MDRISIIIPLFNEEDGIDHLINELSTYFDHPRDYTPEIVFVNDGSTDNTVARIIAADKKMYNAKICNLSRNFGSHAALRAGIFHSTGNYVCFLYADLQDPICLIDQMFAEAKNGYQIVWGKRKKIQMSFFDKMFSRMYAHLMRKYVHKTFPEQGFDVALFSRNVANELNKNIESHSSIFLHILTLGFRQSSIEYEKSYRKFGSSKWTLSKKIKLIIDSFVSFSFAPIRFVSIVGCLIFFIGIVWTGYLGFRKFIYNDLVSGWPSLLSILLMGFGLTNISLGIIAEYLWRALDASRKRPVFIIEDIIELNK